MNSSWWAYMRSENTKASVNRDLLWRVWAFATPYRWHIVGLLATIAVISTLSLLPPLLFRDLIDNALPNGNSTRLNWLALGMVAVPIINGLVGVLQRHWSSQVGEGVIYDLRRTLYQHMQRMSLRFFTETRTGELMSRLNNDVVGAQSAVTGTLMNLASNIVSVTATLVIMLGMEWRLTLL
ncbi:MAG: ABC transporter transmembrane domain-containing protein, partial [Candidatus Promineifilaceae bacterium]